ncbi:MAG TPA: c-type cytochrome [Polyangiaceae bacterium]|nr:c-type cytochrome [Polyangiaceae bacterium]
MSPVVRRIAGVAPAALALGLACGGGEAQPSTLDTPIDHGRAVFDDPRASESTLNFFACSTCHVAEPDVTDGRTLPGAPLGGVTKRATYWAGQEDDLLRSINACRTRFMGARDPWARDGEEAKVLYAYLDSLPAPANPTAPVPFTVVQQVADLPAGDPTRGAAVYEAACASCHGARDAGFGRIAPRAPLLPGQTLAEHTYLTSNEQRLVFVEKVRHGVFLGYSGTMPPFSLEVLSDGDFGALLAYLGLYRAAPAR